MEPVAVIILAAGLGKRMGLDLPKVTVSTRERPLIQHVLITAAALNPERIVVVTGHKREQVEDIVAAGAKAKLYPEDKISFALQKEQRGTGDAVKAALPNLKGFTGTVLIMYGDAPLIKHRTLAALLERHHAQKATLTMIALKSERDSAYGRIARNARGHVEKIIEVKDCTIEQRLLAEHNAGFYAIDSAFLTPAIAELKNENKQKEYYLTDIVERAATEGQRVEVVLTYDADEIQGVNTQLDLVAVNRALERYQIEALIARDVFIEDPTSLHIDPNISVEAGAKIGPNVQLRAGTKIGAGVVIEGTAVVINSTIAEKCVLKLGVRIEDSKLAAGAVVGPFANLRPGTVLEEDVKIGNFVETKKAHMHRDSKASHLTYLGDCEVGERANIGAGTITCNYDGVNKNRTSIGADVFIGSDTCLVAPVTVEDGAYVGAGSVITKKVEKDSLALTRAPLVVKPGWAKRKREHEK